MFCWSSGRELIVPVEQVLHVHPALEAGRVVVRQVVGDDVELRLETYAGGGGVED
jgi:hypothetical protein